MQIRPISDLKNNYAEIEDKVLNSNEVIYLTKDGYGAMVLMSLDKYSEYIKEIEVELKEYPNLDKDIELEVEIDKFEQFLDSSEEVKKETHKKALENSKKLVD